MESGHDENRYCLECKSKKNPHFPIVKMETCKVLYNVWEMQCCGKPFKIGSRINWLCAKITDEYLPNYKGQLDYLYQAHECVELLSKMKGIVKSITVHYYKIKDRTVIQDKEKFVKLDYVDGWTEMDCEWEPVNYIVELENVTVREPNKRLCIYDLAEGLQ